MSGLDNGIITAIVAVTVSAALLLFYYMIESKKKKRKLLWKRTETLTEEDVLELQVTTHLEEEVIRALYLRYDELDSDNSGTITAAEFCRMKEMVVNPLGFRIFDAFDKNDDGHLDFSEFINLVTVMSHHGTAADKLLALFSMYDVDGDGRISRTDLKYILELVTHRPKTKEELKGISKEASYAGLTEEEREEKEDEHAEEANKIWDGFLDGIVSKVMFESSSHPHQTSLSAEDFSKAISETRVDYQEKMNVEIDIDDHL